MKTYERTDHALSRGIVDAEMPKLFLDPVKIEETLGSDTVYKRELYLASENNLYIKGLATQATAA